MQQRKKKNMQKKKFSYLPTQQKKYRVGVQQTNNFLRMAQATLIEPAIEIMVLIT